MTGVDPQPCEGRDDDSGRTEDDQSVAETGSAELVLHTVFRAGGRKSVTPTLRLCIAALTKVIEPRSQAAASAVMA